MDVGEPHGSDWNLRNSRTNMLMNLTSLALDKGPGPGGDISREAIPYEGPQDQPPGKTNTRVSEVVKSSKNPPAELNWNQRTQRSCGEVTEDTEGTETTWRKGWREGTHLWAGGLHGGEFGQIYGGYRGRSWTVETGNGGEARGGDGEGRERASATTFREVDKVTGELGEEGQLLLLPMHQDGVTLNKECVRSLWSVNKVNSLPSRRNRKCLTEE